MALNTISPVAKIVKFHVENFLSLKNVEVELGKLNVFVGPNASGKSNLAKAFQLLRNHVRDGVPSLSGYRSFKDIVYGFDETVSVVLEVEANINNHNARYTLTLTADNYFEQAWINNKEALKSNGRSIEATILTQDGTIRTIGPRQPTSSNLHSRTMFRSILISPPINTIKELRTLAHILRNIAIHSLAPERIRAISNVNTPPKLGYHGDNLARVLLYLYLENRRMFASIEDVIRNLIPEVEEVIPHLEGTQVEIWLRVKGLMEPLKPANISDGTLRILAYVVALYSGASLVVFEEPENCIHPHLLETIVDLARKAPCQVIMTTHSPYLLDHVKPEEVFVVEKPETATTVKKLSKTRELQAVKKLLEEGGTLGEAWYSGLIGGTPETT